MRFGALLVTGFLALYASILNAGTVVMYGGLGGHGPGSTSTNDGSLVTIDQLSGGVTLIGHPAGVARLTGLAFDSSGVLFGSTVGAIPFPPPPQPSTSTLVRINRNTGALLSTVGPITDGTGGPKISISDLAEQPGTGKLFGVLSPVSGASTVGNVYSINKSTGVATLIGSTGHFFDSIAFAPDGTLYATAADLGPMGAHINPVLLKLNPSNAKVLGSVTTDTFFGALGVRPTDGTIFAGNGDGSQIFTLNATTGAATALPSTTGSNFVGDIDFAPKSAAVPLPPAALCALPTLFILLAARRQIRRLVLSVS